MERAPIGSRTAISCLLKAICPRRRGDGICGSRRVAVARKVQRDKAVFLAKITAELPFERAARRGVPVDQDHRAADSKTSPERKAVWTNHDFMNFH